ncbi:MAG: helix-turn-helix transcriptional regulator [Gammaproteobacteria bacterium]|nr:helix-turn-helix transcriptional regulator [Gammaproteobacteria bacterium]
MVQSLHSKKPGTPVQTADDRESEINSLISLVGTRVHTARMEAGLSRRELSEVSGVSQRYLVQLENGEGNISIGLLKRIAIAFERPIDSFLIDDDEISIEAGQVAALYRTADVTTRKRVQQLLSSDKQRAKKAKRICLIGLRGAGKSTLGAMISEKLGCNFIELTDEIERTAGIPISEVIALYGQDGYRDLEAASLKHVIESEDRMILAVAGGVVSNKDTFATLLSRFNTVWVKAAPEEHMERVRAQGDMRPMADNPQAMAQLRQILTAREANYKQADYQLDTASKSLEESFAELSELLQSEKLV